MRTPVRRDIDEIDYMHQENDHMDQLMVYLNRLRQAVPFPCSTEDAYFGCVPETIKTWHGQGFFTGEMVPGRVSNLRMTLVDSYDVASAFHMKPLEAHTKIFIAVGSEAEYQHELRGVQGFERIFWMAIPENVPRPRIPRSMPFYLPKDHPQREVIINWVNAAYGLEDKLRHAEETLHSFLRLSKTRAVIHSTWPELLNFLKFKRTGMGVPIKSHVAEVKRKTNKKSREKIIELLTTGIMLPDKKIDVAWVTFKDDL